MCLNLLRCTAGAVVLCGASCALGAEPRLSTPVTVFAAGVGYPNYRIPSLVSTADGTLIAIAEGRQNDDPGIGGDIDLVCRRSTDGGATWAAMQVIDNWTGGTVSNATSVVDQSTGRVWLLYNRWEGTHGTADSMPGTTNNTAWVRYSDNAGANWSAPTDITTSVKDFNNWNTMAFGPGSGIQASNGRLIIPASRYLNGWNTYAVYSSDHGGTWTRGQLAPGGNLANENQLVQLADGKILMDARPSSGTAPRLTSTSTTGGLTWSTLTATQGSYDCEAAIERFTLQSAGDDRNRIVWTGPKEIGRSDLVIRTSYDEAQTYTNERLLYDGYSGYSDVSILQDRSIGVLFETAQARSLTFTKLNRQWIEPPQGLKALESFRYNDLALGTKNGGIAWNSGWVGATDLSGTPSARIEGSDLAYTNFPFAVEGARRVFFPWGSGGNIARAMPTPIDLGSNQPYYLSLLIRQDAAGTYETEGSAEALDISLLSGTTKQISFGVHGDESFYYDVPGQSGATASNVLVKNSVYYLVAKIVPQDSSAPGNLDRIYIKAFRTGDAVPAKDDGLGWTLAGTAGVNSSAVLDRIFIKGGSLTDWLIDELRIGTTFGAVVSNVLQYKWLLDADGAWTTPANWLDGVPSEAGQVAEFTSAITVPRTVNLAAAQTVGGILFDNANRYTLSGAGITLDAAGGTASISVLSGSHTIGNSLTLNDSASFAVVSAGSTLSITGALTATGKTITKTGAGVLQLENVRADGLSISGGTVRIGAKPQAGSPGGTSVVKNLGIAAGTQLDLTNNSLIIDYAGSWVAVATDVRGHLQSSRLASSLSDSSRRLGYADNQLLGLSVFGGQPVDATSLLVQYTYAGDANLDGQVDISDLGALATAWQSASFWTGGDFNYDGFVDISDLGMLATNWQLGVAGSPAFSFEQSLASLGLANVSVPEPASTGLAGLGLVGLLSRRGRKPKR